MSDQLAFIWFDAETYEREIERYGGLDGMELAERLFMVDSSMVSEVLPQMKTGELRVDRMIAAGYTTDCLTSAFVPLRADRLNLYSIWTSGIRPDMGADYRETLGLLKQLLTDESSTAGDAYSLLRSTVASHRNGLLQIAEKLDRLLEAGGIRKTKADLCRSYVHMHCNRLLGPDLRSEQRTLILLKRCLMSLESRSQ